MEEWLLAGWTVEVKVRKSGKKDRYYTDPISGYVFRSMRDVFRYCASGDWGSAVKPKDKISSDDVGMEDRITSDQSLKWNEMVKGEQILKPPCTRGWRPFSEHTSRHCVENTGLGSFSPTTKYLEQHEGRRDTPKSVVLVLPAYGALQPKRVLDLGVESHIGHCESKNRMVTQLPHQAPKHLDKFEANPTSELNPHDDQACQVVTAGQFSGQETTLASSSAQGTNVRLDQSKDKPGGNCSFCPFISAESSAELINSNNGPSESVNTQERPFGDSSITPEDGARNVGIKSKANSPLADPVISKEDALEVETETKDEEERPGSSLTLPFGDSWSDPCIEFAIKTLTGVMPVEEDISIEDIFLPPAAWLNENR